MTLKEPEYILEVSSEECEEIEESSDKNVNGEDADEEKETSDEEQSNEGSEFADEENETGGNSGWADSIAKILKTNKPKRKKTLVLSKAKKFSEVKKEKPKELGFQIEGEIKEEKSEPETVSEEENVKEPPIKKRRKEKSTLRIKPNILDKDKERTLSKIATRGVVQLFNAVRLQQKSIQKKLDDAGPLVTKKEKVMKSIDKRAFLDVLMGEKSQPVDGPVKDETKKEADKEIKSSWNVLRDDFMMGAKFKDWDKETEMKEESEENEEFSSDSD